MTVFGNSPQHEAVRHYLRRLREKASAQVLIEARIVEVELSDESQSGVNWVGFVQRQARFVGGFRVGRRGGGAVGRDQRPVLRLADAFKDFTGILKLVRTCTTRVLPSAVRLTVMNNQTAILKVARNEVYFSDHRTVPHNGDGGRRSGSGTPVFSSTPRTVPVGLVMTVQPAVGVAKPTA